MSSPSYQTLIYEERDRIARVQFNREKDTNAFSRQMTLELIDVCGRMRADAAAKEPRLDALVLTGGTGRSFSVGGDFNDVSRLSEEPEIRAYLGEIIDLYIAVLDVEVPVVAAIDKFAIGQGLQVALMADWRIGATSCRLQMPELKNGVACPLGSIILELMLGRARMQELVFDCEVIEPQTARSLGLLSQIVATEELQDAAMAMARRLGAYPRRPFVTTKRIQNQRFVQAFEVVREPSSQAHVASFLERAGQKHFERILGTAEKGGGYGQ
ncbi:MAG: enoyl-CoA hydratase/isomerase family protein [Kofleriaceae bacterium]|nr:MAG: enoyl-CoA hydratase/isomerase family protein [Kofleriaceae bacterium]MBZ0235023.1 enoyl-CoA hydratase/isomerase family protein [Kofleriaceae bacterium]